jgi:hypothetical protein
MKRNPTQANVSVGAAPSDANLRTDLRDLSFASEVPYENRHWPWHDNVERFSAQKKYFNWFIYPNVNFTSIGGVVFPIQQYNPGAPDRTDYILWVMTGRQKLRNPATPAILWSHAVREKYVIGEDSALLEALQSGLASDSQPAFHGAYEIGLRALARSYLELLA